MTHSTKSTNGDGFDTKLLLHVLTAVKNGDFTARLPVEWTGLHGKIADVFNDIMGLNERLAVETERAAKVVGKEGRIAHRANMGRVEGAWSSQAENLNALITDLTQSVALEVEGRPLQGEFLRAGKTVNTMVEQLGAFTAEVTRVAREVGTEGKLGGQAKVKGVSGTWKDLTESVNSMASNLTAQVRNIADVTISVAGGDLGKKITVDLRGEFLQLKDTINTMVDQLRSFASEVSRRSGVELRPPSPPLRLQPASPAAAVAETGRTKIFHRHLQHLGDDEWLARLDEPPLGFNLGQGAARQTRASFLTLRG